MIGPPISRTLTSVPSGTICPRLLRTWNRLMSSIAVAEFALRLNVTCQCRPNSLKLLTYSEPRYISSV